MQEMVPAGQLVVVKRNDNVEMSTRLCKTLLDGGWIHLVKIEIHQGAKHSARRASNEPLGLLSPEKVTRFRTISRFSEVPRLSIRLERANVES